MADAQPGIGAALAGAREQSRRSLLRNHGGGHASVSNLELFFDLVFVFAITQLSHYLLVHLDWTGALQAAVLFFAVWWAWMYTTWATNWIDPDRAQNRIAIGAVMLASLVMAAALPHAFGKGGGTFVASYLFVQIGRTAYTSYALGEWRRGGGFNMLRATLWFVAAKTDTPRRLEWKGSHIALAIHPEGEAVVTAMQENSLHGWRLPEGQHMRMSGYASKPSSLSFSKGGRWLASSGSDAMVLWPFFGGGPMGKAPIELAGGDGLNCTQVAAHPKEELVAGGFEDGLVVVADITSSRILPIAPPGRGPVTALAWSADGTKLALGTEQGFAAIVDFSQQRE